MSGLSATRTSAPPASGWVDAKLHVLADVPEEAADDDAPGQASDVTVLTVPVSIVTPCATE
jgi:hypothetical protein